MVMPPTGRLSFTRFIDPAHFRIFLRKPHRLAPARGSQKNKHSRLGKTIHHPVQPGKLVNALFGLQRSPGKYANRCRSNTGLLHQFDITLQYIRACLPLVGIIIRPVEKTLLSRDRCLDVVHVQTNRQPSL